MIAELSTLRFVEERRNALFLGPPGVGKTISRSRSGIAATEAGYRTYFTTAADLVAALAAAHLEGSWSAKMRTYTAPSVLVIDELGYLPLDAASAHWIFQVVSRRYERGSIVLTSNRGFGDWGQVFADQVVASAILDRLAAPRHGRQHQGPELSDAGPPPAREGGRYARLTSIASAPIRGDLSAPLVLTHTPQPRCRTAGSGGLHNKRRGRAFVGAAALADRVEGAHLVVVGGAVGERCCRSSR